MNWPVKSGSALLPAVINLARRGTVEDPGNPVTWRRLVEAQLQAGNLNDAMASLAEAERALPNAPELFFTRATVCQQAEDFEGAIEALDRYLSQLPEDTVAKVRRFELLVQAGLESRAKAAAAEIALVAPQHPDLIFYAGERALEAGNWEELLRICDARLAGMPNHTNARFHRALALARLGRDAEAKAAMDLDRFVAIRELPVPDGFAGAEAFRAALREEILRNPTLLPDPRGKSTRKGRQTQRLLQPDAVAVEKLLAAIRMAVGEYADQIRQAPGEPDAFVTSQPADAATVAWAVVYGAEGSQDSHIHPEGWLSGTFYVAAPETPAGTREGTLVLGAIKGERPPWGLRYVEPKPGRLVLFPSWIPHATEATNSDELRICVAFDVVPAA